MIPIVQDCNNYYYSVYYSHFLLQVTILITDINDHPPYFDKTLFNITIFEDETLDTILAQVVASDVDSSVLTYELVLGNDDGKVIM